MTTVNIYEIIFVKEKPHVDLNIDQSPHQLWGLTFNWTSQVSFADIVVLNKKWAIFIALTKSFGEDTDISLHHFYWTAMFNVHPGEEVEKHCSHKETI